MEMELSTKEEDLDPRVQRTRRLLVDAFVALLGKKAYSEISVKEIAARATVNRTTFYAHFIDKEDLFKYFCRKSFERMLSEQLPDSPASSEGHLSSLLTAVFKYMDWHARQCHSSNHRGAVSPPEAQVRSQLQELLLSWMQQSSYDGRDATVAPEVVAVAISAAVVAVARTWSRTLKPERPALAEMTEQLQVMIAASLEAASIGACEQELS